MKKIICILVLVGVCFSAFAQDIKLTIPDDQVPRIISAMKGLYKIPTDKDGANLYTDAEWAKLCLKRWVVAQVKRYEYNEELKKIALTDLSVS